MSTETPVTDGMQRAAIVMKLNYMAKQYTNGAIARGGSLSKHYLEEAADIIKAQEAENARLREELADRSSIRCANCHINPDMECEPLKQCRGELAEAKREIDRLNKWADSFTDAHLKERQTGDALVKETMQRAEQAEARALAAEKDAGRYQWLRNSKNAYPLFFIAQRDPHNIVVQFSGALADMNIDAHLSRKEQ